MSRYNSMEGPVRGTVAQALAQARASLKEPSRPFTPAETRHETQYESRPSSVHESRKILSSFENEVMRNVKGGRVSSLLSKDTIQTRVNQQPPVALESKPVWVREMDDIIMKLDQVMTKDIVKETNHVEGVVAVVRELLNELWPCVESMAGACSDGDERWVSQRNRLFASLFRVLERKESDLRLYAARCVLSLLGAGRGSMSASLQLPKYETAVCKVLFQLTKVSNNDEAFFDVGVVEPMISLLEAQSHQLSKGTSIDARVVVPVEAPVYLVGALKNISSSETAQTRLGKLGAISVLCGLLRCSLEKNRSSTSTAQEMGECKAQLLTHVTGTLRNLSIAKAHHKQLASCGAPSLLCELVGEMVHETELMFNITRILAKISLHESLRSNINSNKNNVLNLLDLLTIAARKTFDRSASGSASGSDLSRSQMYALLVRVSFTLGNLTASNEKNRVLIGSASGGDQLVSLLQLVFERYEEQIKLNTAADDLEELLVKLIRLIANLSISAEVGPLIAELRGVMVLVPLLELSSTSPEHEELLLNVVSAITNLSFYYQPLDASESSDPELEHSLLSDHKRLCSSLVEILLHDNIEAVTEAARAFGNISRYSHVRNRMLLCGAGEALVILLDHSSRDVVFAATGALVNIGADSQCNKCLTVSGGSLNGCCKLVHILRRAGLRDLAMAAVASKALYNLLASYRSDNEMIEAVLGTQLELLHQSLDELLDAVGEDGGGFTRAASALFALVSRVIQDQGVYEDLPYEGDGYDSKSYKK